MTRLAQLRQALFAAHPHLARIGQIAPGDAGGHAQAAHCAAARPTRRRSARPIEDFYLTNPDRARLRGHGRMLGARRRRAALTAAE